MRRSQNALSLLSFLALPVLYLFAAAFFVGTTASGAAAAESRRVLMLHSFGPRFKPWSAYAETIRSEINRQSRKSVDFVDQSLVSVESDGRLVRYRRTVRLRLRVLQLRRVEALRGARRLAVRARAILRTGGPACQGAAVRRRGPPG